MSVLRSRFRCAAIAASRFDGSAAGPPLPRSRRRLRGNCCGSCGAMGPASASVATAAAVPTPVATLPSRVAAAAARDFERQRNESGDLQLVKRLAWELLYASGSGHFRCVGGRRDVFDFG